MPFLRAKFTFFSNFWLAALSLSAGASPLAEKVSTMRTEVEALADELETQRLSNREELSRLRAERADLERKVRLEQIRKDTLDKLLQERTRRLDDQEGRLLGMLAPIKRSVGAAKAYVKATMPFKREERLRQLSRIEADLAVTHPDLSRALTGLWRFVEEEEAMAQEVSLAQQVIELDGQRSLADVVRIGLALMYFRLPNGTTGWVVSSEDGWRYESITAPAAHDAIVQLFNDVEQNQFLGLKRLVIAPKMPVSKDGSIQ